ncbi:MAG: Rieske (2Fe-2S) protein [Bacteroidales bacterium]
MYSKSKIIFSGIIVAINLLVLACSSEKNDVIPDVYVDFYISLDDPEFFTLNAPGNSVVVTYSTNNLGVSAAGYDSNGIIIYRVDNTQFYAFDRTCPHDYAINGLSVKVNIDGIYAVCPRCSTTYALPAGGVPASGPARYPLKNYKTSFNGIIIHVWNK